MSTETRTTYRTDEKGIRRTAIIVGGADQEGSIDLVDTDGNYIARINIFSTETWLGIDVIDTIDKFSRKHVLAFNDGRRESLNVEGKVAAVDFRR